MGPGRWRGCGEVTRAVRQLGQRWSLFIGFAASYLRSPLADSLIFVHLHDRKHTQNASSYDVGYNADLAIAVIRSNNEAQCQSPSL